MKGQILFNILFIITIASSSLFSLSTASYFDVLDYGAVGDGQSDDSQAFLKAWSDMCASTESYPTLFIPKGREYMLEPIQFQGPCKTNSVHFQLQGTIVAPKKMDAWKSNDLDKWIQFLDVINLVVDGGGQINGNGRIWWKHCNSQCTRPTAVFFNNCNGLQLNGIEHINSQRNHISIHQCNDANISNLKIHAPEDSPNTDGINLSGSTNVNIQNSVIGTGDDCIAINNASFNVNISNISCGPGHGISIGSLGEDGAYEIVEDIHVRNCNFLGTQNGVRIKTWEGGSGYARKISFEKITLKMTKNPIIINQHYSDHKYKVKNKNSDVRVSEVIYREIYGTSTDENAIILDCSDNFGCTNIEMDNVKITTTQGKKANAFCKNAHGRYKCLQPSVPCLSK